MKQNKQGQKTQYFQKQGSFSMECGMHCINNLLKDQKYTKQKMEQICYQLSNSFINPHKHIFGGDYDINVVMIGFQKIGYQCKWIDKRNQFKLQTYLGTQNCKKTKGFILNLQMQKKFYHKFFGMSARHWISVRVPEQKKQFQLCDSSTDSIEKIKYQKFEEEINNSIKNKGAEVFWVYKE